MPATLIVFSRLPVEGRVKTRLAATVGNAAACRLYHEMAIQTLETALRAWNDCKSLIKKVVVYHSSDDETEVVVRWVNSSLSHQARELIFDFKPQLQGLNLGSKMHHALTEEARCDTWAVDRVMIIGTDCPSITPSILTDAAAALDGSDIAIGPAVDGGYYLLGLTSAALRKGSALFEDVEWSTDRVLSQTLEKAKLCGLNVAPFLPLLRDIDTIEDLRAVWPDRLDRAK